MGTLSGLMSLSSSALNADQAALDIVSNNIANQNTAGYTRETVNFTTGDAVTLSSGAQSTSVSATAVSQRSRVLEQQLQQQTQASTASTARLSSLQDIESMFGLSSSSTDASSTTIGTSLNSFFSSLTALSSDPTDTATKTAVLTAAQNLASAFNSAAQGFTNETSSLNSQITTEAQQVNSLTATVARLNQQIAEQDPNTDAGTLEDQRQQAILQLSSIMGVSQITTENNGITLTASDGSVLVSGAQSYSLSTTSVNGDTALVGGNPPKTMADIQGGSIGGMMQTRDSDIPAMQQQLDQLAYALGSAVNTQNAAGTTSSGVAGTAIFTLPSSSANAAATISVSTSATVAAAATGEGSTGTGNALALANLSTTAVDGGQSASDAFSSFIGDLGSTVASASNEDTANSAGLTQAQTQRDSLSGVSLNDEASALTQYQRSYEAAAKLFDIVNELMASALNLGEETTVS